MSKQLFFSDLHCHNHEQFSHRLASGRNSRLQDCINIVLQAAELVEKENISTVYFLGDTFHARTKVDIDVLTGAVFAFRTLSSKLPSGGLVMLVGNHDQYSKVGDVYSTDIFREFATVVDKPSIIQREGSVALYPYTTDIEGMKGWLQAMPKVDLLLFHQGVSEAAVGPYDMHVKTELSIQDIPFDKCRYAIAGDYHKRQFLAGGKFHYVGSPLQLSFGERDESKCFTIIDEGWNIKELRTTAPCFHTFTSVEVAKEAIAWKTCDPEKDFLRVISKSKADLEALKVYYPRIQVVFEADDTKAPPRISNSQVGNDKRLLETYVENNPSVIPADDLLLEGLTLLGEE